MRRDTYKGIPREWRNGMVWNGLVCGKSIRPRNCRVNVTNYMVREDGKTIYSATTGTRVAQKALDLAMEVADRHDLN
jgi:hypothetical protein